MAIEAQNIPNHHNAPKIENLVIYVPIRDYICRESSTNQLFLCKTNPILSAVGGLQMNLNIYYTKVYNNETAFRRGKNKPNSNPISKQLQGKRCFRWIGEFVNW